MHGKVLEFDNLSVQSGLHRPLTLSSANRMALDNAILILIQHEVVENCDPTPDLAFYSNIFSVRKRDGTTRVILNLS